MAVKALMTDETGKQIVDAIKEKAGLEARVAKLENEKFDKSNIAQGTGTAEDKVMSQRATSEELEKKFDKSNIVQSTGDGEDKVMSRAAATKEFDKLSAEITDEKSKREGLIYKKVGSNLLDSASNVTGCIQSNGTISVEGAYATYLTSDYIKIEPSTDYVLNDYTADGSKNVGRKAYLLYDENKEVIAGSYYNQSGIVDVTINNESAHYVRVSCGVETLGMVEEGTVSYGYFPYEEKPLLNDNIPLTEKMKDETSQIIEAVVDENTESIAHYEYGKNLVNPENNVIGFIQSNGTISVEVAYAAYLTSDYIKIEPSTDYVLNDYTADGSKNVGRKAYLLYDENKEVIAGSYYNQSGIVDVTINNESAHYVRVSCGVETVLMLEKGTTSIGFEPYYKKYVLNDNFSLTKKMEAQVSDVLKGKKWIPCGDSFTAFTNKQFESGIFIGKDKTYPRLIAERTGISIDERFFKSGRTIAYPSDGTFTNSLCCPACDGYYQNIPEDADYITIMLGINDEQHKGSGTTGDGEDATGVITLGTIDSTDTSTYYGAFNTVLAWLRENRPFAHVGIIVSNGIEVQEWVEAQINIAKKWGYSLINLNGDERTPAMIRCYNPNMSATLKDLIKKKQAVDYDGTSTGSINTHPNWQAHEYESTFIEAWLKSI